MHDLALTVETIDRSDPRVDERHADALTGVTEAPHVVGADDLGVDAMQCAARVRGAGVPAAEADRPVGRHVEDELRVRQPVHRRGGDGCGEPVDQVERGSHLASGGLDQLAGFVDGAGEGADDHVDRLGGCVRRRHRTEGREDE